MDFFRVSARGGFGGIFWVSARGVFVEYVVGLLVLVGFWFVVGNWVVWLVVGVVW